MLAQTFVTEIKNAVKNSDVELISNYLDLKIDITFNEEVKTYNQKDAKTALKKIFNKVKPLDFKITQKGNSMSNNTTFCIGEMKTKNENYRIYLFFIEKGGKNFLKELRFENKIK